MIPPGARARALQTGFSRDAKDLKGPDFFFLVGGGPLLGAVMAHV